MPTLRPRAMNDQHHESPPQGIGLTESGRHSGIAITKKIVVRVHDRVIVFALVEHWILAARRNHDVFHAVAIQIANHGLNFRQDREFLAKLLLHKIIVDFELGQRPTLTEGKTQRRHSKCQEKKYSFHGFTLVPPRHPRQVTKVTTTLSKSTLVRRKLVGPTLPRSPLVSRVARGAEPREVLPPLSLKPYPFPIQANQLHSARSRGPSNA